MHTFRCSHSQAYLHTYTFSHTQVFTDVFARENQLIRADPRHGTYLACGLLMRGAATISDVNRNIARLKPSLRMAHWNDEVIV